MDQHDRIDEGERYGPSYYSSHCGPIPYHRAQPHWGAFFGGIAETLVRSFRPRRVYDAGCAMGFLVEAFWDRGVECWGRDISPYAISEVRQDVAAFCSVGSIAEPMEGRFDLVTCIEVVEHMPEAAARQAIQAIASVTDRILFSSSPTDLEEPTHLTVRPAIYWLQLFAAEGFAPLAAYDPTFVTQHGMVLERAAQPPSQEALHAYAEMVRLRLHIGTQGELIRAMHGSLATQAAERDAAEAKIAAAEAAAATALSDERHRTRQAEERCTQLAAAAAEAQRATQRIQAACAPAISGLAALQVAHTGLQQAHNRLLASSAWQVTRPLRAVMGALPPELRRRLRQAAKLLWWSATLQLAARLRRMRRPASRATPTPPEQPAQTQAELYLHGNPDVAEADMDPLTHFVMHGALEGRTWPDEASVQAGSQEYFRRYPDVAASGMTAWAHFRDHGRAEGRRWDVTPPAQPRPLDAAENAVASLPWVSVLRLRVDPALTDAPRLNVLLPGIVKDRMSGGPNTAVNLACRLASSGIAVRLVTTGAPPDADLAAFWSQAAGLSGTDPLALGVEVADASGGRTLPIGENDLFMATAWWTAQSAKYAVRHTRQKRFLYLIQDYEPLLHPASTQQALAAETYRLDHVPVINSFLLRDYLVRQGVGRFADPAFAAAAFAFQPAVDTTLFFPTPAPAGPRRRLLFYARPSNGLRNLFELGVAALRTLVGSGAMDVAGWEFCGMGEAFDPVDLGAGCTLRALPWQDLAGYAEQMRGSDVLLSPMLSPHPSYPPLEMAACGRPAVTTVFANKDAEQLAAISPNIIAVEATVEGLVAGLLDAIARLPGDGAVGMPATWSDSLDGMVRHLRQTVLRMVGAPALPGGGIVPGYATWPTDAYAVHRNAAIQDRAQDYQDAEPALLSFITPVWNTAPAFLEELAATVFGQDAGPGFEWVIVDNGSTSEATRAALAAIAAYPDVRLLRVERNIGIVSALRMALEHAERRYVVPLDSDDLLAPDCVRVLTSALRAAGLPPLAYTDEDKQLAGHPRDAYCKPDWDPVLFAHSCYIAHLCAIDRAMALALGCYTDRGADGSSDWDSFTRFMLAGHTPLHVPELLYTWRMHPASTALDIGSKDYIYSSQRTVLTRFLEARAPAGRYGIAPSPLFAGTPDWRFTRNPDAPGRLLTLVYGAAAASTLPMLLDHARQALAAGCRLHLLAEDATPDDERWADEASTLFELFPDTVLVGGRVHHGGRVVAAAGYFGFDGPYGAPMIGRALDDPGYFAQALKPHSADMVPLQHCVADPAFLVDVLPGLAAKGVTLAALPAWLGAAARAMGRRCVYSPFLSAAVPQPPEPADPVQRAAFALAHGAVIPNTTTLSRHLGLTPATAYQPVLRARRAEQERAARQPPALPYPALHAAERIARHVALPADTGPADIAVLTTVYARTDAALFRQTAASLAAQTLPFGEWVILAHGPIAPELDVVLHGLAGTPGIRLLRRDGNLGIVGGMRVCLEAATQRLAMPLDADDLLTPDAIQLLTAACGEGVGLAYSDEDLLVDGVPCSPVRRGAFDPVLNDADSTIWHLCAFDRSTALRLGVYSDPDAEYCHDWDTIHRFAAAGAEPRHVPHVLYRWRQHRASLSHGGGLNPQSLRSVAHVLEGIRARQADPARYAVRPYPISRGVEQLALLRRHADAMPLCLAYLGHRDATIPQGLDLPVAESHLVSATGSSLPAALAALLDATSCGHIVLLREGLRPCNDEGPWEAMRLFEMHADLGACAGRVLDAARRVVACCDTADGQAAAWIGTARSDPGEYARALKPQTATSLAEGYLYCTAPLLRAAAGRLVAKPELRLEEAVAIAARALGLRLAYSPLIEACPARMPMT